MRFLVPFRLLPPVACAAAGVLLTVAGIACFPGLLGLQPRATPMEKVTAAPRLSWADLTDADTAVFARNLRAIGCPEGAIQRIVTPHEQEVFVPPPPEVETSVPLSAPALPTTALPPPATPAPYVATAPDVVIVAPVGHAPLPVAFQALPQDARMTNAQRAQLNAMQEQFIADIGGTNQDPASPDYLARWREAQRKCDAAFKAVFGQGDFMRRLMATSRAEQAAKPGS